jgi:hypothetical protein
MTTRSWSTWRCGVLTALVLATLPLQKSLAQGCVPAKGAGISNAQMAAHDGGEGKLFVSTAYRWLHSDRHFVGSEEQKERRHEGSEVINDSHFVDFSFTYRWNSRYSTTLSIPLVQHDRSQVVRDSQRRILERFHTQSSGIGDVRLLTDMWIFDPSKDVRGNALVGLGIELPTGKKDVQDTFHFYNATTSTILRERRNVDQSIQPGDGGYAVLLDVYAYRQLNDKFTGFVNGSYSVTPQEKSGVQTRRSNPFEAEMSIMDSFIARGGVEFKPAAQLGLTLSLGARIEGVPVHDLVGGSDGFRRPGYSVSVEPGVVFSRDDWTATLYVPVSIYQNRTQSVPDKQLSAATNSYRHGDAAFTDELVLFSFNKSF